MIKLFEFFKHCCLYIFILLFIGCYPKDSYEPYISEYIKFDPKNIDMDFDGFIKDINDNISEGDDTLIKGILKSFASSLSFNLSNAIVTCVDSVKFDTIDETKKEFEDKLKLECEKMIRPLLEKINPIFQLLNKQENLSYKHDFLNNLSLVHKGYLNSQINGASIDDIVARIVRDQANKKFSNLDQ